MLERKVIAIDIGSGNIKIIEGARNGNKVKVFRAFNVPTPENSFVDGQIVNPLAIKEKINDVLKGNNIKTKSVIFTTDSSNIITRIITVPFLRDFKEMDSMIRIQMQQYLPIKFEDYLLQFIILEEIKEETEEKKEVKNKLERFKDKISKNKENENAKARVRVAIFPKDMAEGYLDLAKDLKLVPLGLDLNFNALTKLLIKENKIQNQIYLKSETVVIIDIGQQTTKVNIISKSVCEFTKTINYGGLNIDLNISNQLGMDVREAEKLKIRRGSLSDEIYNDKTLESINRIIKESVEELARDISKIIQYYKNTNDGVNIDKLYICGGSSLIKGIGDYFMDSLDISVFSARVVSSIDLLDNINGVSVPYYLNALGAIFKN